MSDMLKLAAALDAHTAAIHKLVDSQSGDAPAKTRKPRTTAETAAAPAAEPAAVTPTNAATVAAPVAPTTPVAPAAAAAPAASAPASAASAAGSAGPTLQKVADAIIDLANNVSREAAVSVLTKYEAQKVPQIKPADFAAVLVDVGILKAGGALPPKNAGAGAGLM